MVLTHRQAEILGLVVDEYIDTAAPVSSKALVDRHGLRFSTATVRNDLARLEEDGYITQPHTSAGRVPSDRGYRLYVEQLMAEQPLRGEEQRTIAHQFHQASTRLEDWLTLAASVLSAAVANVAVITRPRNEEARLRHLQLVQLSAEAALLVAVMDDGLVQQRLLNLVQSADQPALTERAMRLNARLEGADATGARAIADELHDVDDARTARTVADLIDDHIAFGDAYVDGVRAALEQPEFASAARMLEAVRHLQAYELMRALPTPVEIGPGSTRIVIGHENSDDWMQEWSLVASTFDDQHGPVGTIAVLGPTRMRYAFTIPRVRYVAALISTLLQRAGR